MGDEPAPLQVADALEELVNQFSDPFSFLRELVQNALDAGSDEVEVSVRWESGEGDDGVTVIRVEDWGDGMNREIILKKSHPVVLVGQGRRHDEDRQVRDRVRVGVCDRAGCGLHRYFPRRRTLAGAV